MAATKRPRTSAPAPSANGKKRTLTSAARDAFRAIRADAPDDRFYFFALYTTEDGSYVGATAWSEEALARAVAAAQRRDPRRSAEELAQSLRFSAPDSPFHDTHDEGFADLLPGRALHDACFDTLRELDGAGFFGRGGARSKVILNVVYGDMSDERWLAHANRLNSRAAVARALPYLRVEQPSGRVEAWGGRAYQVRSLALSGDRARIAYVGSDGELALWDVRARRALATYEHDGAAWAVALSRTGERLYLGDAGGVSTRLTGEDTTRRFARSGSVVSLVLSPDERALAVCPREAGLKLHDTSSRALLWESKATKGARVAFAPDGSALVAVAIESARGKTAATVTCFDAGSGRVRWATPLGPAMTVAIAWGPGADEILVSASQLAPLEGDASKTAIVAVLSATTGAELRRLPWTRPAFALAVSPDRRRIALASERELVILDAEGRELTRGKGKQESLSVCVFPDDRTALAAGRDVNRGPALLSLEVAP